jgi:hypothetical protein
MAEMSAYCKAYPVARLRAFAGWTESAANLCPEESAKRAEGATPGLSDNDYLFLHDSFIVTAGIFRDENVIFAEVSPQWKQFCTDVLDFHIPEIEPLAAEGAQ